MGISESELRDKVGKLMAMAGTEGDSYAIWTVNQIVHGLKNVAPGVRAPGVELVLKQLERDGIVKCVDPGEPGRKAARWVRLVKIDPPEHMEKSPFEDLAERMVKLGFKPITAQHTEEPMDPEENEEHEVAPIQPAIAGFADASDVDRLNTRIDALEAIIKGVVQRADNMDDVMKTLNGLVGTIQENFKNKLRNDRDSANQLRFDAADLKKLDRRVASLEKQFEEMVELLHQIAGMADQAKKQVEDNVVGVIAVSGRDKAQALREVEELAHEWLRGGDSSMAADLAKRGCGATIVQVLSKHGVLTDDANLCGD